MAIIHFTTELSGGAGYVVNSMHQAALNQNIDSYVITRDKSPLKHVITVKPFSRLFSSIRARFLTLLGKLDIIDSKYAMFGIENSPVNISVLNNVIKSNIENPEYFIFYWISYFIKFDLIKELRDLYPETHFIFIPLDEALMTGGCHYTWGCSRYEDNCASCPSSNFLLVAKRVEETFKTKKDCIAKIAPVIFYPSTQISLMGDKSALFFDMDSCIQPLGAAFDSEVDYVKHNRKNSSHKLTLFVRSSSERRKGTDIFVTAINYIISLEPQLNDKFRILSIGDDEIISSNLDGNVEHIHYGYVDREGLVSLYAESNLFVNTSREDTGPIMINESVAFGVYVISTPVGVSKDLITDAKIGAVSASFNYQEIGELIAKYIKLYKDYDTPDAGLQRYRQDLTFEKYVQNLVGFNY